MSAIKVSNVSMIFNMTEDKIGSLKEYLLKFAKGQIRYREFSALKDISFAVEKGGVFGIVGLNGSGKSTLLKIIAGILKPTRGNVSIKGTVAPLIELGAGFDMELTARENIYLNGSVLGYNKKFIDEHFDDIVEFSELYDFLDVPMKNYSSGMVARVGFAIATVIKPDILIVDEILGVGDYLFQQKCERRINELMSGGTTVLLVSHSISQIRSLCKHAMWLEKGIMKAIGDTSYVCDLYEGKNTKAVYTAICGRYDELKTPTYVTEGWDYICFTDDPELRSDFWRVVYWDKETAVRNGALYYDNPRKLSKFFKMNPHLILSGYAETFWIDGAFDNISNLNEYVAVYLKNSDMLCCKHPERDCIYDEAEVCKQLALDSARAIDVQIASYRADGYPAHNGLLASGCLYRKNTKAMRDFNEFWYSEIMNGSVRDQLSFNYCAWKLDFNYDAHDLNYWNNPYFKWYSHNQLQVGIIEDKVKPPQIAIEYDTAARIKIESFIRQSPLFKMIQIETYNRCNSDCAFCQANRNVDVRKPRFMDEEVFTKIIAELGCERYSGFVSLFSNNEPFLDKRIFSFARLAKKMLPNCYLYIMTNGSLLDTEKVIEITSDVDMLIIDNYNKEYALNPNIKDIYDYCSKHEKVRNKVKIQMRLIDQVLTTRGGKSPNRAKIQPFNGITCLNPFEQLVIRSSGEASLCCCDAYGEYTLGNVGIETLKEVWFGNQFDDIRKKLQIGREQLMLCDGCDVLGSASGMDDGRHITAHWEHLSKL